MASIFIYLLTEKFIYLKLEQAPMENNVFDMFRKGKKDEREDRKCGPKITLINIIEREGDIQRGREQKNKQNMKS